jgi:hypothetical protein
MKTAKCSALALALAATASNAATMSLSFWGYDQYAGSTPYYSHYYFTTANPAVGIASIDLYDQGWGNNPGGNSSYHYMSSIENSVNNTGIARSIGWHRYEFIFNDLTMAASLLVDGNTIRTGAYANTPTTFRITFHDYYGGVQETVIDDFQYRLNGSLIYQQGFDSSTLDSRWSISFIDAGTYVSSGDPSNPYTGTGALALGATAGGQWACGVEFDLIPELSTSILSLIAGGCLFLRRHRNP